MKINCVNEQDVTKPEVQEVIDKLEALRSKPRSPEYISMMDNHRKELTEIVENAGPWEWSYGLDAFVEHLKWMRDYYKLGENVWAAEMRDEDPKRYKNYPTRLETLEKTLNYYDKWQNLEDEYVQVVEHGPMKWEDNQDGTSTLVDSGVTITYKFGPKGKSQRARRRAMLITYKKLHKAERKYKKLFFKAVEKYLESWWD